MKTLVACNILDSIKGSPYISHCDVWYQLGKTFPKDDFYACFPTRMAIDAARNFAAIKALQLECDYLMFYDDDMLLHPQTFKSLLEADADIAMAQSFVRGTPFHPMFFKWIGDSRQAITFYDDYREHINTAGLVEDGVAAVGFSTVLIKTALLKQIRPPYFVTGSGMTEDVYFCLKAQEQGLSPTIKVDTKVCAGHQLNPEFIHENNVDKIREFYKANINESRIKDYEAEEILKWMNQLS